MRYTEWWVAGGGGGRWWVVLQADREDGDARVKSPSLLCICLSLCSQIRIHSVSIGQSRSMHMQTTKPFSVVLTVTRWLPYFN